MKRCFDARRATWIDVAEVMAPSTRVLPNAEIEAFETLDLVYRATCALLYNYVPTSGHPGGSISSGRFVAALLFGALDYDLSRPNREDADILSYAAGHKAMGLYAMWALRDEIARLAAPELLPDADAYRLRLEDLLGFRRNPIAATRLCAALHAKSLDGHPTPATPFVHLATGASGVGLAGSIGLAIAARDFYGTDCPTVHFCEGEGGLTPGRVSEALAAAGTASLSNVVAHIDFNQSSIDSDRVCRDGLVPGDYVQWQPAELFYLNDWNVVTVADGHDFQQVVAAQRHALAMDNGQPTAVIYRTHKGWRYGVEGRASHGAGHKLCTDGFYKALAELTAKAEGQLPICESDLRCIHPDGDEVRDECFWAALGIVRRFLASDLSTASTLAARIAAARERLDDRGRAPRQGAPTVDAVYALASNATTEVPEALRLVPGASTTLREALGRTLGHFNEGSGGALLTASADLLCSTSASEVAAGFPGGYWNARTNPESRVLSIGGICEDAMSGVLSGISAYGHHVGVGSSYGAFMAPLGHIAARLHAIGAQARRTAFGQPFRPVVLICAHAGLATGEDGPTHADPQALQLLQENFPPGTAVTLTPWDPQELWPLMAAAFTYRSALVAPFVTRPAVQVLDRVGLGLAGPEEAAAGLYCLHKPHGTGDVTVVLQESAVTYAFVTGALPLLEREGIDCRVYYVASAELFDALPAEQRCAIFPEEYARRAMGITGFTLPTLHRWVLSEAGRAASLDPYRNGHFLGSGRGEMVLAEAGLDGESQFLAIKKYLDATCAQ